MGKITIIKTYLILQCVHMISGLPRSDSFLKELNNILYKFLWNNKPDKIRRSSMTLDKTSGGMQMIDMVSFDKSLKGSWVQKLYTQTNSQWCKLVVSMYKGIDHICNFRDQWSKKNACQGANRIWQDVLNEKVKKRKSNYALQPLMQLRHFSIYNLLSRLVINIKIIIKESI